jgi:hypothetical protein
VGEQLVVQRGVLGQRRLQLGVEPLQLVVAPLGAERDPGHQACDAAVDEHQRAEHQALRQSVRWEAARLRSGLRHGHGGHPDGRPRRAEAGVGVDVADEPEDRVEGVQPAQQERQAVRPTQ